MENAKSEVNYKYFIIAEVLAVVSFILNTINVILTKEGSGPYSAVWVQFGPIYWLKNLAVIFGLIYFFKSHIFWKRGWTLIVSCGTLLIIAYSIPVINFAFQFISEEVYRYFWIGALTPQYQNRITIQAIWSIPVAIPLADLIRRLILCFIKNEKK